ncbi:MAG: hypothetical protein JWM20_690 [Patescibacteria group bacterium]|nr:hypothetical protein [Patescibacteria group bacterium]
MHDTTHILTFGKHKGEKVSEVPVKYLTKLHNRYSKGKATCPDPEFLNWINENIWKITDREFLNNEDERQHDGNTIPSYTVDSRLSQGKYKKKRINDIPIEYLLYQAINLKVCFDKSFALFIKKNMVALKLATSQGKTHVRQIKALQPFTYKTQVIPLVSNVQVVKKGVSAPILKIDYTVPDDYKAKKENAVGEFFELVCSSGKIGFSSHKGVVRAMKGIIERSSKKEIVIEYFCNECHKWHFTSQRNYKKAKRTNRKKMRSSQ